MGGQCSNANAMQWRQNANANTKYANANKAGMGHKMDNAVTAAAAANSQQINDDGDSQQMGGGK